MKYDEISLQKIRDIPIFDVCSKLNITLYGMGKLTKRAKCWYHNDTHPSMHINKTKNIFKCFVCGKGGDVIKLVQDNENLSFIEACDWLVREFNITVVNQVNHGACPNDSSVAEIRGLSPDSPGSKRADSSASNATLTPLDPALVEKSLSTASTFCQSLVNEGYLTDSQMQHAASRYRLGASKEGRVIFWEIDEQQRVHTGKLMHYQSDCHRDKTLNPTWVHALMRDKLPNDYELRHCLFGLHLLSDNKAVCVVESEKTAIILSELFPDFVWLSCGGLQMFKPELLAPMVNHKVVIFPDTDETGETFKTWSDIAQQASKLYFFQYPLRVSTILELQATPDQKSRKIDLVDFLFESKE